MKLSDMLKPDNGEPAGTLHLVATDDFEAWRAASDPATQAAVAGQKFRARPDEVAILPGREAGDWTAALGVANVSVPGVWDFARAAEALPPGTYRLASGDPGDALIGWALAQHRLRRFRQGDDPEEARVLLVRDGEGVPQALNAARATARVRDMVDMPPNALGPAELEAVAREIAAGASAQITVVQGEELARGYPLIAAVGQAAGPGREPRLLILEWGAAEAPLVALVGKGVCFDSGGLDIKPAAGMRLMKKDMGGAAHVLALAEWIMAEQLPVRLLCLVPAVENAVGGAAMRPGDILTSRKGTTVEIDNTDAEGRLILADALTHAVEQGPELILDFATLTGAARVALGPDLPALFANDEQLAQNYLAAGEAVEDPLWRLPLWEPYREMLKSEVADMANAGGGFAGAVTAALFLKAFVPDEVPWAHVDTFAWRPAAKPGRPKGGEALSLRAAHRLLSNRYQKADHYSADASI